VTAKDGDRLSDGVTLQRVIFFKTKSFDRFEKNALRACRLT